MSWFYDLTIAVCISYYRALYGFHVRGHEHIPPDGPVLIAANHVSLLDPPAVGIAAFPRRLHYMAKHELFDIRWLAPIISNLNAFPINRTAGDTSAIRHSLEILQRGEALLVFPEGGRNQNGQANAKNGISMLARLSGAKVVPAYIAGTQGAKFRRPVTVSFGPPICYDPRLGKSTQAVAQWRDELMAKIFALKGAHDAY